MNSFNFRLEIHSFNRSNAPIYFLQSIPRCPAVKGPFLSYRLKLLRFCIPWSLFPYFVLLPSLSARMQDWRALVTLFESEILPSDSDVVCHLLFVECILVQTVRINATSRHVLPHCTRSGVLKSQVSAFGLTKMTFGL